MNPRASRYFFLSSAPLVRASISRGGAARARLVSLLQAEVFLFCRSRYFSLSPLAASSAALFRGADQPFWLFAPLLHFM